MSIEQAIQDLTAKVDELIFSLDRVGGNLAAPPSSAEPQEEEEKPKTTRRKKTTAKRGKAAPAKTTQRAKKEEEGPGEADVKAKLKEIATAFDQKTAVSMLETYGGVKKIGDLEEADYLNVIMACDEKLAEYEGDDEDEDDDEDF